MRRGVNALLFTAALASAGCVTDTGKLTIRPLADPLTKAVKAGNPMVAEGRGLLAVGSVGLAIEAFRKALREQPDNIEALAGLAECYDQMGRHDLSKAKYEAALAIAPNNVMLLRTFAASLEQQGKRGAAMVIRHEAAETERAEAAAVVRMAAAAPVAVQTTVAPLPVRAAIVQPKPATPPVRAPMVQPKPAQAPVRVTTVQSKPAPEPVRIAAVQPKPAPAPAKVADVQPAPRPVRVAEAKVALKSAPVVGQAEWKIEAPTMASLPAATASVTVKLPPAPPARSEAPKIAVATSSAEPVKIPAAAPPRVEAQKTAVPTLPRVEAPKVEIAAGPSVTVKLPPARPAASPGEKPVEAPMRAAVAPATQPKTGPRLERLSLGEVALLTDPRPRWRTEQVRYTAIAAAPRFVPLAELQRSGGVRLLNAARHQGLAARTRLVLNRQGWDRVTIGDAARTRRKSLILYSAATEQAARRLAARYGIWIAKEARPGPLTILLGRDWVMHRQERA